MFPSMHMTALILEDLSYPLKYPVVYFLVELRLSVILIPNPDHKTPFFKKITGFYEYSFYLLPFVFLSNQLKIEKLILRWE
jgi:hypothetical protein